VLNCVTASCTRCGTTPLDEDTGLTPHFAGIGQAAQELAQDWGWHYTARSNWPDGDELLCPACAQADHRPDTAAPPGGRPPQASVKGGSTG
jgi:hypothetical protein